jgi:hypothetical protein
LHQRLAKSATKAHFGAMKTTLTTISKSLQALHRRFLENEKLEAEKVLDRKLSPFDFLRVLTQDPEFKWLQPFSALIAEIDTFIDETEEISAADVLRMKNQIDFVLKQPRIGARYQHYVDHDPQFIPLHLNLTRLLATTPEESSKLGH